ncbi:PAS domain-containing protein [Staphylococcus massiliensis]|uniref:two-component system histidine kinase PnpS n=1 Tax=Staphylococcus massiliensis TaxID=555791 RepID=UPI001EDD0126|nr:HAMP domain-containing sensor histidine kinase [Staphylococcus massiliensis]MCG3400878.1 PAS domain-containing protein [Staphylococcus massiliensis]
MIKFYHKLLLILTTIIVVSFLLLGFIVHNTIFSIVTEHQTDNYKKVAKHVLEKYQEHDFKDIRTVADHYNADVLIEDGKQQYDYHSLDSKIMKDKKEAILNDLTRSEDHYYLDSVEGEILYGYESHGIKVIGSYQATMIKELQIDFWKYLFIIFLIVMVALLLAAQYINRSYIRPINEVTYATKLLAKGNYRVRVPESSVVETRDLFVTTNVLARKLARLNSDQKIQTNRLETTLQNVPSAILMIDNKGEIVIANQTYYEIFYQNENIQHQRYTDLLDNNIKRVIFEAFKTEQPIYEQIELYVNKIHQRFYDMACVPILSKNRKKLQGMVVVFHDITKLQKLEKMRREFVANVSHELRTPITSIKGFAETLQDGAKHDEASLDMFLSIMLKESNRIQSLVDDLLDLSKIEQNSSIKNTRINLSQVAASAKKVIEPLANRKDITLITEIEPDVYTNADENKISQVIVNLMTNAVNYSPEDRKVTLRIKDLQDQQIIEVEDEGIGIGEEEKPRIFERFYRVDKARSRDSGGTGLGLSITKHIVEAFNGTIEVESEVDKGSLFRVTFYE